MNITNMYADGVVIILFSELIKPITKEDAMNLEITSNGNLRDL